MNSLITYHSISLGIILIYSHSFIYPMLWINFNGPKRRRLISFEFCLWYLIFLFWLRNLTIFRHRIAQSSFVNEIDNYRFVFTSIVWPLLNFAAYTKRKIKKMVKWTASREWKKKNPTRHYENKFIVRGKRIRIRRRVLRGRSLHRISIKPIYSRLLNTEAWFTPILKRTPS